MHFRHALSQTTGQLLNMQSLASDVGVSDKTIKSWWSILETCYLIHYLRPHFSNFGKRLVKQPKLYMTDVGLAAALIGIQNETQARTHPLRGALFETLVVNEFLKSRCTIDLRGPLYFWRDNIGTEVGLIVERGNEIAAIEVKSGPSVASDAFGSLRKWQKYAAERGSFSSVYPGLVYGGDAKFIREGVDVLPSSAL